MNRAHVLMGVFAASVCTVAAADSFRQQYGYYENNAGVNRSRVKADGTFDMTAQNLTSANFKLNGNVSVSRDVYDLESVAKDKYSRQFYESGTRVKDAWSAGVTSTVNKLTDVRLSLSGDDDSVSGSNSAAIGMGQWFWHESLQWNLDLSRTLVHRPEFAILDSDSDIINAPPLMHSTGVTASLKHLATPTTITRYTYTRTQSNERPAVEVFAFAVKKFFIALNGAMHADVTRAINKGRITTSTSYGEVDAWLAEVAWLQNVTKSDRVRVGYRQYREDEITRAERNEYFMGSDMVACGWSHDMSFGASNKNPFSVDATYATYRTNEIDPQGTQIRAQTYEMGATARF
jgi:hypothetical protein